MKRCSWRSSDCNATHTPNQIAFEYFDFLHLPACGACRQCEDGAAEHSENIRGSIESKTGRTAGGWRWGDRERKMEKQKGRDWRLEWFCGYVGARTTGHSWQRWAEANSRARPSVPPTPPSCSIQQRRWILAIVPMMAQIRNGSIDLYIHAHAGGARWWCTDTKPKANLFSWLPSLHPPPPPGLPLPVCFYSTQ